MALSDELGLPTREDLHDEFMEDYRGELPDKDTTRGSEPWSLGRVVSGVAWGIASKLLFVVANALPDLARGWLQQRWGNIFKIERKGASPAQGVQALLVSGTPGTAVPAGIELAHGDGTLFQTTSSGVTIGGGGTALVSIVSTTLGAVANKVAGESLTFSAPPPGVVAEAVLQVDLSGGLDQESEEDYGARLVTTIGRRPQGGAIGDYLEWILAQPGVATAYLYRHRRGQGTLDGVGLGHGQGSQRVIADPSDTLTLVESKRPGGQKDFAWLSVQLVTQDVTMEISSADPKRWKWDWDDGGVDFDISAINAGLKQITVTGAPASIVVGVRLTVDGEEARVVARVGTTLTLNTWFSVAPTPGISKVRASGDLVAPARAAILDLFTTLGPARGNYAALPWEDTLRVAKLYGAVVPSSANTGVQGVSDGVLITPTVNVAAEDDAITTSPTLIKLIVPGKIRVRKLS